MGWLVLLIFLLMWIPELPGLLRRRQWPELAAFGFLWAAGLALSLLIAADVPVNQLNKLLRGIFEPIGRMVITKPPD